ncbi:MAG: SDR family NAD(P)-dependent oxidoreductase [Gemmatimonadales bacterium]|nr:SDR family NAD(P)-dependent oxidoreductase [Gemmatimonadales bacterium]MBA3555216.1 SDR family NAD(P)-dependent oxidoreductase [Gemmatimonadales bacterium]
MELRGKTALVTGASSGIGAATARELARAGCRVILLARRQRELDRVAASLGDRTAAVHALDLTDADAVTRVARRISADLGTPDVVVNNAGAGQWKFVEETSPAEAVQMMAAPYFAGFFVTGAFLPGMLARNSGHIVNVSSAASRFVWPGATAYTAARWAVRGFTEALRADLARTGIGVTLFESGVVATEYWASNPGSRERVPGIGRLIPEVTPEEAARAIVRGVERNRKLVVVPLMMRLTYLQHALFPGIVQWLMTRTGYRRPLSA